MFINRGELGKNTESLVTSSDTRGNSKKKKTSFKKLKTQSCLSNQKCFAQSLL